MIYLDWAATAPPDQEALRQAQETSIALFGNPSSLHRVGAAARDKLEDCRQELANHTGCLPESIVFTSGGTEANNLVLGSSLKWLKNRSPGKERPSVVVSGIEHASVFQPVQELKQVDVDVAVVAPDNEGYIDTGRIADAITKNTKLVAVMTVNNETGAIQRIDDIAAVLRDHEKKTGHPVILHTDGVQALGKIPLNIAGADTASFSAHKIGGPKGAGALLVRNDGFLEPLYRGGGQERGLRPGTEALYGSVGFTAAVKTCLAKLDSNLEKAKDQMSRLITELRSIGAAIIPEVRSNGDNFSPYILKVAFPPVPGEVLTRVLSEKGICVSTGSACSSRSFHKHRVLKQMGISDDVAASSIRISQGSATSDDDLSGLVEALKKELPSLMRIAGGRR